MFGDTTALAQCNASQQDWNWNPPVTTVTTGGTLPYAGAVSTIWNGYPYYYMTSPVAMCSGESHIFPCPHCDKCKCGAATVKRAKSKERS